MKFSIVTPSYNQARWLEQAMRSVLDQEGPEIEYFVMDGGSTDGSVEIIRRHESRLTGWVSAPDGGQAAALAAGFARCTGDILGWINSDDYFLPEAFRIAEAAFREHPGIDLVYGDAVYVDAEGRALTVDVLPGFDWEDLLRVCMIPQQAAFWRRDAYEACGGIDPSFRFCMDYDLLLKLASSGRAMHLPRLMGAFRHHPAAKTAAWISDWNKEEARLKVQWLGREGWNRSDWLRMKWLTMRQIGCIIARRLRGERFPVYYPARWARVAKARTGFGSRK